MTPDLKLASFQLNKKATAASRTEVGDKQKFADALWEKMPRAHLVAGDKSRVAMSQKDRLISSLSDRLKQQFEVESGGDQAEGQATDLADALLAAEAALQIDSGQKEAGDVEAGVDDEAGADGIPDSDTEQDDQEQRVLVGLQAYLHTRENPSAANSATRHFDVRATPNGQPGNGSKIEMSEKTKDTSSAANSAPADGLQAPATTSADDRRQASRSSDASVLSAINDGSQQTRSGAKAGDTAAPAAKPVEQMNRHSGVQIQITSSDALAAPAQTLVETIKAEPSWAAYFRDTGSSANQPIKSLKIQLHPAELGTVTAQVRAAGDGLEIEITADTDEAHKHLAAEADDIMRSLRQVGIDVDKVTVHQADNGANSKNSSSQEWRNFSSFQGQDRREGETANRGRGNGGNAGDGAAGAPIGESRQNPAAGRYI